MPTLGKMYLGATQITGCSTPEPWVRPTEWPALPSISTGEQKLVGLYAVHDTASEFVALTCVGDYTVDWGDGSTENVASGVKAQHQYTYASVSGSPISLGYKVVTITVTPQAGQTITESYLNRRHSTQVSIGTSSWLDVFVNLPSAIIINIGGSSDDTTQQIVHGFLESVHIGESSVLNARYIFNRCRALRSVSLDENTITNMERMFYHCYALVSVSLPHTEAVTRMPEMFSNCSSLKSVLLPSTGAVTDMYAMFEYCSALTSANLPHTESALDMSYMFNACKALTSVALPRMESVLDINFMFSDCRSLRKVSLPNTGAVTNISYMFYGCYSLTEVLFTNTGAVESMSGMFIDCYAINSIPELDITSVTTMSSMFSSCRSLARYLPVGTKLSISFSGCNLMAEALNEIFTNLSTVTAQTITITSNPGAATCDRSIATAKGWTVTG